MKSAYERVGGSVGAFAYDTGLHNDEFLMSDNSLTSDGSIRENTRLTLATAPTKVLSVAERVMGETLRRVQDDGLAGIFSGTRSIQKSPPMVIELRSRVPVEGEGGKYLGVYLREKGDVHGRAHWRHVENPEQCLAYDGSAWWAQPKNALGEAHGVLRLRDPKALTPDLSIKLGEWEVLQSSGYFATVPSILCYVVAHDTVPREFIRRPQAQGTAAPAEPRKPPPRGGYDNPERRTSEFECPTIDQPRSSFAADKGLARPPPAIPPPSRQYLSAVHAGASEHPEPTPSQYSRGGDEGLYADRGSIAPTGGPQRPSLPPPSPAYLQKIHAGESDIC